MSNQDDYLYKEAKKRVAKVKGFYRHITAFVIVGSFFFMMNILNEPWDLWFYMPLLPWSMGLAFHYVSVFGLPGLPFHDKDWENEQIEQEMKRMRYGRNYDKNSEPMEDDDEDLELRPLEKEKQVRNYDKEDFV